MKIEALAKLLAAYAIIPGAVLYFAGYVYVYFFCKTLGIAMTELNYDAVTIMVFSIDVLVYPFNLVQRHLGGYLYGAAAGAALLLVLVNWGTRRLRNTKAGRHFRKLADGVSRAFSLHAMGALIFVLAVAALYALAYSGGIEHARTMLRNPGPLVQYRFQDSIRNATECDPHNKCKPMQLVTDNKLRCLHQIQDTLSSAIVVCAHRPNDHKSLYDVFVIPKSNVVFTRIQISP